MDTVNINITELPEEVEINVTENVEQVLLEVNEVLGRNGLSAYEIALANGFVGTEEEWLDSLQGSVGGSYRHQQHIPAATWNVNHGLGYKPGGVAAFDSAGTQWYGDVTHVDVNNLTISFGNASFGGEAYIS